MQNEANFKIFEEEEGWQEITNSDYEELPWESWRPEEPGDALAGFYFGLREFTSARGPFRKHVFRTKKKIVTVNANTVLNNALKDVREGTPVKIIYRGERTSSRGWTYKDYSVLVRR